MSGLRLGGHVWEPAGMRLSLPVALATAAALLLAGCSDSQTPEEETTQTASASPTQDTSAPEPSETVEESEEPTESPSAEPTEEPTSGGDAVTELSAAVLLPAGALDPADGPRTESEGVVDWKLPEACSVGAPTTAAAMRSVVQGDGANEVPVGFHQVAVFADTDAAVAEAARINETLTGCTGAAPNDGTRTVAEPVEVGAQGRGLVVDYHGTFAMSGDENALGYYTAVTRRGNAVTLVASAGGENTVSVSREVVTGELGAAWDQLCAYDSAGC